MLGRRPQGEKNAQGPSVPERGRGTEGGHEGSLRNIAALFKVVDEKGLYDLASRTALSGARDGEGGFQITVYLTI